jgi:hypothetical protein
MQFHQILKKLNKIGKKKKDIILEVGGPKKRAESNGFLTKKKLLTGLYCMLIG